MRRKAIRTGRIAILGVLLFALALQLPVFAGPPEFIETWSPEPGVVEVCWITMEPEHPGEVHYGPEPGLAHAVEEHHEQGALRNHRVRITGLDPEATYQAKVVSADGTESAVFEFRAAPLKPAPTEELQFALRITEPTDFPRTDWPAVVGVPLPQGKVAKTADLRVVDSRGKAITCQAEPWGVWRDGSVRWAILSFPATTKAASSAEYQVIAGPDVGVQNQPSLLEARPELKETLEDLLRNVELTDAEGQVLEPKVAVQDVVVEADGPVYSRILWRGLLGEGPWTGVLRATAYADIPLVKIDVAVYPESEEPAAVQRDAIGRFFDLRSLSLSLPLHAEQVAVGFDEAAPVALKPGRTATLQQLRDDHWKRHMAEATAEGERSDGFVQVLHGQARLAVNLQDFWQTYPSAYRVGEGQLQVQMLPALDPDEFSSKEDRKWHRFLYPWFNQGFYHMRAGQMTRHTVRLYRGKGAESSEALAAWLTHPIQPVVDSAYLCASEAWSTPILPQSATETFPVLNRWDRFARLMLESLEADLEENRTYGWMSWGDWFGERFVHYGNNEYDTALGLGLQYMRTGNREFLERAAATARHVASVDTMHHTGSREVPVRMWMHPVNHVGTDLPPEQIAGDPQFMDEVRKLWVNPQNGVYWTGGTDHGHKYYEGLWLMAALTGDPYVREASEHLTAGTVELQVNDSNLWWGYERDIGYPLSSILGAYRLTANPYHLNAARILVQAAQERQDPVTGGWPGGQRPFAASILLTSVLRYLEEEPRPRSDVRQMVVDGARWLTDYAWDPGAVSYRMMGPAEPEHVAGFRESWVRNKAKGKYEQLGNKKWSAANYMGIEGVAFAYQETGDEKYLNQFHDMVALLHKYPQTYRGVQGIVHWGKQGVGKQVSARLRQTIYGFSRMAQVAPEFMRSLDTGKPITERRTPAEYRGVEKLDERRAELKTQRVGEQQ